MKYLKFKIHAKGRGGGGGGGVKRKEMKETECLVRVLETRTERTDGQQNRIWVLNELYILFTTSSMLGGLFGSLCYAFSVVLFGCRIAQSIFGILHANRQTFASLPPMLKNSGGRGHKFGLCVKRVAFFVLFCFVLFVTVLFCLFVLLVLIVFVREKNRL